MCNNPKRDTPRTRSSAGRQRGLSIIELMVSIVIALLVGLAATGSAISFTSSQRQNVGAGGVAVNAATVLSAVKDDMTVAGLGFFGDSAYLCDKLNLSVGASVASNGATFAPLRVTRTADGDTIDVVYGSRVESGANIRLKLLSDGTSVTTSSYLPASVGQAVLLAPSTAASGTPCLVRSVTANTPSTPTAAQVVTFGAGGKHNAGVFTVNPTFDDDTGRVTVLGDLRWNRYRVLDGNLIMERPLEGTSAILARNVISFRVQFGASAAAAGSTTLETWEDPAAGFANITSANIARVRAMRIGLIVRSPQPEKPNAAGVCSATETKPVLFDNPAEHLSNADWNCYRYRTATVVAPMRNVVMGLR